MRHRHRFPVPPVRRTGVVTAPLGPRTRQRTIPTGIGPKPQAFMTEAVQTAPVAVLGAPGQQGSATVDALLDRGLPVRAITRNVDSAAARALTKRDVAVVAADLETPESIRVAFEGAAAAFAMTSFTAPRGAEGQGLQGPATLF